MTQNWIGFPVLHQIYVASDFRESLEYMHKCMKWSDDDKNYYSPKYWMIHWQACKGEKLGEIRKRICWQHLNDGLTIRVDLKQQTFIPVKKKNRIFNNWPGFSLCVKTQDSGKAPVFIWSPWNLNIPGGSTEKDLKVQKRIEQLFTIKSHSLTQCHSMQELLCLWIAFDKWVFYYFAAVVGAFPFCFLFSIS